VLRSGLSSNAASGPITLPAGISPYHLLISGHGQLLLCGVYLVAAAGIWIYLGVHIDVCGFASMCALGVLALASNNIKSSLCALANRDIA